jgi:uncharacterized RDD family membrane protein YckC
VPKVEITTPEQVVFRYEAAGLVSRALAWLLDYTIIFAGYLAIILIFAGLGSTVGSIFILLGIFVLDFSYFAFFEIRASGQTPGKRIFSLRVISAQGQRLRFADAMIRNLLRPIDVLPLMMVVGGTVAFFDRQHRRLGDMAAETVVIRESRRLLPQALVAAKTRVNTFQANRAIQQRIMTRITRDERDLVLDLALRRDHLDAATRETIFAEAAAYFRERFALPEDLQHLSDEQTVINLALVIQDAKFTG